MRYVSDIIGEDEFKSWGPGQRVFITAATGTGKTTFILDKLLIERAIGNEEKILYLVNRRILKEQLENKKNLEILKKVCEKHGNMINVDEYICVMTYQSIEGAIKNDPDELIKRLSVFDIVVYDECHYFYMDSNFNTNTELSYDCLRRIFDKKIQIFISATMEKVRSHISKYDEKYFLKEIGPVRFKGIAPIFPMEKRSKRELEDKEFLIEQDYSYVRIDVFETYEELADIISGNTKEKWLVFADNIEKGKDLQKQIRKKIQEKKGDKDKKDWKDDIVLIDARFKKKEDSNDAIEEIVEHEKFINKRILIATSVMDNGISIVDKELRNIVIMYDTEEEFIQMIGRKRNDGEILNLYICKRNKNHFRLRLQNIKKKIDFYGKHKKNIERMYERTIYNPNCSYNCMINCKSRYGNPYPNNCDKSRLIYCPNNCVDYYCRKDYRKGCKSVFDVTPFFDLYWCVNSLEYRRIYQGLLPWLDQLQANVLNDVVDRDLNTRILYTLKGHVAINCFSANRIYDLFMFYSDMETKMEGDEYAFVREQLRWLNMEYDEIDSGIVDIEKESDEKYLDILRENIEERSDVIFTKKENKEFKTKVSDAMVHFLSKNEEDSKKAVYCGQNDRVISEDIFNRCMQITGLPYRMTKPNRSTYLIEKVKKFE